MDTLIPVVIILGIVCFIGYKHREKISALYDKVQNDHLDDEPESVTVVPESGAPYKVEVSKPLTTGSNPLTYQVKGMTVADSKPFVSDRSFQMFGRYFPGSKSSVDPLLAPSALKNKYKGDWTKFVTEKGAKTAEMWEAFRDEVGRDVDTYAKFLAKFPGGKRHAP